jgi:hypothetical protein
MTKRKKYMECEGEFSTIRIVKPKFPNAVTRCITTKRKRRGVWSSDLSTKPTE